MKALLSIKPEFVKKIFSGEKLYEYRKVIFKQDVKSVIVYSTKPEGMIVGEFAVEEILEDCPKLLWEKTKSLSGVNKKFYDKYFQDKTKGYAIKIGKRKLYDSPINPDEMFKSFTAPQSFCYISSEKYKA